MADDWKQCPKCSWKNPPANKFCGRCGTDLKEAKTVSAPDSNFRQQVQEAIIALAEQIGTLQATLTALQAERADLVAKYQALQARMDNAERVASEANDADRDHEVRIKILEARIIELETTLEERGNMLGESPKAAAPKITILGPADGRPAEPQRTAAPPPKTLKEKLTAAAKAAKDRANADLAAAGGTSKK